MTVRALIIAIEKYPGLSIAGMAQALDGTLRAGLDFKAWLEDKWRKENKSPQDMQLIFCSEPQQIDGSGAKRSDILRALERLRRDGPNTTKEFYFFFSGHGFSFVDQLDKRADVIVTSDFEDGGSGHCCIRLDEIVDHLRGHLGGECHYYFVDACRNALDARSIRVGLQLQADPQATADASTFILQSTRPDQVATTGGPFARVLVAGLGGAGKAKVWDDRISDGMAVRYDSLRNYVSSYFAEQNDRKIWHRSDGTLGPDETLLAIVKPVPKLTCTIELETPPAAIGSIFYRLGRETQAHSVPIAGSTTAIALEPGRYSFWAEVPNEGAGQAFAPQTIDLYEDAGIVLRVAAQPAGGGLERKRRLETTVSIPFDASVEFRDLATGRREHLDSSGSVALPSGRYLSILRDRNSNVLRRQEIEIDAAAPHVDIASWRGSIPREAIARIIGRAAPETGQMPGLSEELGRLMADSDLNVWLAIVGAARILGNPEPYHKLSQFPLQDFSSERAGASPLYILAGLENPSSKLEVQLAPLGSGVGAWIEAIQPEGLRGIHQAYFATQPGSTLVSFRVTGETTLSYSIASLASPNRATLITLTLDDEGAPCVGQYLLPIWHLRDCLHEDVRHRIEYRNRLEDVRFLAQAMRAFRKRHNLAREMPSWDNESTLITAQYCKWLDPIACALASYELVRRGRTEEIVEAAGNMLKYFPDVPDSAVLARLAGIANAPEPGIPLFFDGFRLVQDRDDMMPLPKGYLDFSGPWTAWLVASAG